MIGGVAVLGEPMGLRDRKKDRTRRLVHGTALGIFAERGYDNVTVEDVAEACDLSRATIFRYFPTKEHLVVGLEPERLEDLREAFEERPADEAVFTSICHALVAVAQRYEDQRDEMLVVRSIVQGNDALQARAEGLRADWRTAFADLISQRVRPGDSPSEGDGSDLRVRVLAGAVLAALSVAVEEWLASDRPARLADVLAEAMGILGAGFDPDPR